MFCPSYIILRNLALKVNSVDPDVAAHNEPLNLDLHSLQLKLFLHSRYFNTMFTGRLFHCYRLNESICQFKGIGSVLSLLFYF